MRLDAFIDISDLSTVGPAARAAEQTGFAGLWVSETQHDPFLALVPVALSTSRVEMGTAIAVAFPRSPATTAYTSWDLARTTGGRFILGSGTQVKAHIERRFSTTWDHPAARLRDYIGAVRAIWHSWQTGERLRYEGEFYRLTLMTPFFDPGPLPDPSHEPRIFIAGVNRELCRLAGEVCDGFHVHPFHSARYLREAVLPWIEEGLAKSGRQRGDIQVAASVFAITGRGAERDRSREEVRRQVAFYASTPTYRTTLAVHGWEAEGEELSRLASRGRWDEMPALITGQMLSEFVVEGDTLEDAAHAVRERYTGLLDRVAFYRAFVPGERDDEWAAAVTAIRG